MNNKIKSNCCDCVIIDPTPTHTPKPTATPTKTPKPTVSSSRKLKVPTPTPTTTLRATTTPTATLGATTTPTATLGATVTPTATLPITATPTTTLGATVTPTATLPITATPTTTITPTATPNPIDPGNNNIKDLKAIPGDGVVVLTWSPPAFFDPEYDRFFYQAYYKPKTSPTWIVSGLPKPATDPFLSLTIRQNNGDSLANGIEYNFKINIIGEYYSSSNSFIVGSSNIASTIPMPPSPTVTPTATPQPTATPTSTPQATPAPTATKRSQSAVAFPAAPSNLVALEGNEAIDLSWDAPTNPRSGDLFYVVGSRQTTGSAWVYKVSSISSERRAVISALINDKEYEIKVGTSVGGNSAQIMAAIWSVSIYVTPSASQTIAAMPTGLDAIEGNEAIDLSWDAPTNPRSGDLFYVVGYKETVSEYSVWIYSVYPISEKRTVIAPLINGKEYDIKVGTCFGPSYINNAVWSIPIRVMPNIPATVDQIPSRLVTIPGNTIINLSWDAPINPRSEDTVYLIAYREKGLVSWTYKTIDIISATNQIISSLTNGIEYEIRVGVSRGGGSLLTGALWSITTTARPLGELSPPYITKVTGEFNKRWNRLGAFYTSVIIGNDGKDINLLSDVTPTNRSRTPNFSGFAVWQTSMIEVRILSNSNESSYQINLADSTGGRRSWGWTSPVLLEGSHIFKFFALDIKGNRSLALEYNYTVDTTIPPKIIPAGKNDIGGYGKRTIFGTGEPNTWVLVQILNNTSAQSLASAIEGVLWGSVPSSKQALYFQFLGNGVDSFPEYRINVGADGKWSWTYPETFTLIDASRTLNFPSDGILKNIRHPENPELRFCSMDYAGNQSDWERTSFAALVNLSLPPQ